MGTQPLWILASVALGGGLVGGGVVYALGSTAEADDGEAKVTAERTKAGPDTNAARRAEPRDQRLEELEEKVRNLQRSLTARQNLRRYAKALNEEGDDDAEDAQAEQQPIAAEAEDPGFELAVRTVVDRIEWEKNEEAQAERTLRGQERAERQTEMLSEDLQLDTEQVGKVRTILAEQMSAFAELRNPNNPDDRPRGRDEWRERIRELRTKTEGKMGQVLDEQQLSKYRELMEQRRQERGQEGGGRRLWR